MAMTCIHGGECTGCMACQSCRRNTCDDYDDYEYEKRGAYTPYYSGADIMLVRPNNQKQWRRRGKHQEVRLLAKQGQVKKIRRD